MEIFKSDNFKRGWFIGNFDPSLFKTNEFEVAVKKYESGFYENKHFHKTSTEFKYIIDGVVSINGIDYVKDTIIKIAPNEIVDFKSKTDSTVVVVKIPYAREDKVFCDSGDKLK